MGRWDQYITPPPGGGPVPQGRSRWAQYMTPPPAAVPGQTPETAIDEQHPDIWPWHRFAAMSTTRNDPEVAKRYLQETLGFEVAQPDPEDPWDFRLRKAGGEWHKLDPSRFSTWETIKDIGVDFAGDAVSMAGGVAGGMAGTALGAPTGLGAIASGAGGAAMGTTAAEGVTQRLGQFLGVPGSEWDRTKYALSQGATAGVMDAGVGLAFKGLGAGAKLVRRGLEEVGSGLPYRYGEVRNTVKKTFPDATDEEARYFYERQAAPRAGVKAQEARDAKTAGDWIDRQGPPPGDTAGEPFRARQYSSGKQKVRDMTAHYGQTEQIPWEAYMRRPYEELERLAVEVGEQADLKGAPKSKLATWLHQNQLGSQKNTGPAGGRRADDVARKLRTVEDFSLDEFVPRVNERGGKVKYGGGHARVNLPNVMRLESKSQGVLDFENPDRMTRLLRAIVGKRSMDDVPKLAKFLDRAGSLLEIPMHAVSAIKPSRMFWAERMLRNEGDERAAQAVDLAAKIFGAAKYPGTAVSIAAAAGAGKAMKGVAAFLKGDPGKALGKLLYDPKAPPGVKSLAQKALEAIESGDESQAVSLVKRLLAVTGRTSLD